MIPNPDPKEKVDEFLSWAIKTKTEESGSFIEKILRVEIDNLFKKGELTQAQLDRFNLA